MNNNRPLSPHLEVYKLPLTGLVSITHRMTGVMLSFGLVFFVCIVSAIAGGESAYQGMQSLVDNFFFRIMLWGFIYALFFHLCHGVRHLMWDTGATFDLETLNKYAIIELQASAVLTILAFFIL